jgi:phytoene synthase
LQLTEVVMADTFSYCAELVRNTDRDRFVATLFASSQHRNALYALYAFDLEIGHVRDIAREPMPGEIRLQWWREVLQGQRTGEANASPVAAAILNTIEINHLPLGEMLDLIEARRFDLYNEPMMTVAQLEEYAVKTSSAVIGMAARIVGTDAAATVRPAGIAYAIASLLAALPKHVGRGQLYLPVQLLEKHDVGLRDVFAGRSSASLNAAASELRSIARAHLRAAVEMIGDLPRPALPAFLPLAPLRRWLDRLERSDAFAPPVLSPWRRQWLIWRAARNPGRFATSIR